MTEDQSSQASTRWHAGFDKITAALSSQVGLFHEVSNVIRRASRQSQNDRAASSFCIKDQEGNDLEAVLKGFFIHNLQDRFPASSPEIRERLAVTMILRRKRILYRRSRYSAMPIKPTQPASKPKLMARPLLGQLLQNEASGEVPQRIDAASQPTLATSGLPSTVKSATTLDPEKFQRASAPSAVSSTRYTDVSAHEDLIFPSPPAIRSRHMLEVTCPYCLYVLSTREILDVSRWR